MICNRRARRAVALWLAATAGCAGGASLPASAQIGSIEGAGGQACTNVTHGYGKKTFWNVAGANATLKGTVSLAGANDCAQNWIATGVVFCADAGNDGAEVFRYPSGGAPIAILSGNYDEPLGTVAVEN